MNEQEKLINLAKTILSKQPEDSVFFKTKLSKSQDPNQIDVAYAKQVCEISKTKKNIDALYNISKKSSMRTSIAAHKYMTLLEDILLVYENGKDSETFDAKVCEINEFVSSHIVKRKSHGIIKKMLGIKRTTFREVGREDIHKTKEPYSQLKSEAQKRFNQTSAYVSKQLEN